MNTRKVRVLAVLAVLFALWSPVVSVAQAPLQLSIMPPIQLVSEYDSVRGVSLGLIYTVNNNTSGLMLTVGANRLYGTMRGIQFGLVNLVEESVVGIQNGAYNSVADDFHGWQNGILNFNDSLTRGVQLGVFNTTGDLRGLQMGLLNTTDTLYGVQLGLVNLNASGQPFGFLPIINWGF
jgi:hypothetical protein